MPWACASVQRRAAVAPSCTNFPGPWVHAGPGRRIIDLAVPALVAVPHADTSTTTSLPGAAPQGLAAGFLRELHALRGLAILSVVASHAFGGYLYNLRATTPFGPAENAYYALHEIAWHGSTIYFTLISGILFTRVLADRGWRRFYRNKITNVMLPYVVMSLLFMVVRYNVDTGLALGVQLTFHHLAGQLAGGNTMFPYWYMPVLACLFLLTPVLSAIVSRSAWLTALLIAFPLICSRTGNIPSLQSIGYFTGVYVAGLLIGRHYEACLAWATRHRSLLWAVALGTSLVLFTSYVWAWDRLGPVSLRESLYYFQKLALAGLAVVALHEWQRGWRVLNSLATYSFTIYLIHAFLLGVLLHWAFRLHRPPVPLDVVVPVTFLVFVLLTGSSLLVSMALKRLTGSQSRLLVGT